MDGAADAPGRFREWLHQLREPPGYGSFASFDDLAHLLTARNERLAADRAAFVARCWARPADGAGVDRCRLVLLGTAVVP